MTPQTEKAKQDKVKKDREACDHIGYFIGYGMEVLPVTNGVVVLSAVNCMMCGESFIKSSTILTNEKAPDGKKEETKIIS